MVCVVCLNLGCYLGIMIWWVFTDRYFGFNSGFGLCAFVVAWFDDCCIDDLDRILVCDSIYSCFSFVECM